MRAPPVLPMAGEGGENDGTGVGVAAVGVADLIGTNSCSCFETLEVDGVDEVREVGEAGGLGANCDKDAEPTVGFTIISLLAIGFLAPAPPPRSLDLARSASIMGLQSSQ